MVDKPSFSSRWRDYRPSKTLYFWSCAGCVAATILVGFVWGGWVTAGTAKSRADAAAQQARAQLAANYCVSNFEHTNNVAAQFAALKKTESWNQDDFISKGGWVTPPGETTPVDGAAELCVQRLLAVKLPAQKVMTKPVTQRAGTAG